jgi:structural maintenance of chromosome 3 (chondroitin sulfate proteoglycan 6)
MRMKKISEKKGNQIRYKNALSILVSFNQNSEPTRKWSEFSGGQKTVIALSILMALQKCEPAPFYVFDEVDAALHMNYLERIISLIQLESQNSQYFITSFRTEMLEFPPEICNYYIVTN